LKSALEEPAIAALREVLQSPEWQQSISQMAGYQPLSSGEVLSLREELPWWNFRKKRQ